MGVVRTVKDSGTAARFAESLGMLLQEEGGLVKENHYPYDGPGRAPSGHSYYYFRPDTPTLFHILDCDEYWAYHAGGDLEVWSVDPDGNLEIRKLGTSEGTEPCLYFRKGVAFAAKPCGPKREGTLTSLITVPRFSGSGLKLLEPEEVIRLCPAVRAFFETGPAEKNRNGNNP